MTDIINEEELNDYNYIKTAYRSSRIYPPVKEQLDMQFHDLVNGTTTWQDAIQAVKDTHPKPTGA